MRLSVLPAILASAVIGLIASSCDLLNREVVYDEAEKVTVIDSTTVRVMGSMPDSTQLVINLTAPWHADVAKGCDWCRISKHDGPKGRDTIRIYVAENTETKARQTSLVIEAGNLVKVFKIVQMASENWHDIPYWHRTAAQRLGLHGRVEKMIVTDNRYKEESTTYTFDQQGNLLSNQLIDKNHFDTTRTFVYDDVNHRIRCTVTEDIGGNVVRKWRYEYSNLGKLVAYSAKGWTDPDPLAEDMEGMIVPDLSAVFKTSFVGDVVYEENRTYTFENDTRLIIVVERFKTEGGMRVELGSDTSRVSYQYYNSCGLSLPATSRGNVTNSTYYQNGMLRLMRTNTESFDFLDNAQRMAVESYQYTGPSDAPHQIDYYACVYNQNRDLVERKVKYNGSTGISVESYPQYVYDEENNWTSRVEQIQKPEYSEPIKYVISREFIYFR